MKGVFQAKPSSVYDDVLEERYQFPSTYLNQVRACIGDLVVYYEPRRVTTLDSSRGGRQSYFAVARVDGVERDGINPALYYARMSEFLDFDYPVPFKMGEQYLESALKKDDGSTNKGAAGRAVRVVPEQEFEAILALGFAKHAPWPEDNQAAMPSFGFGEDEQAPFERPLVEQTITRPFRDRAFTRQIQTAYDRRCAMTGLRLTNGGGRPEVQAAHIKPVASHGPDSIRNGIALSGTFHWMFDRGLFTIEDDYKIVMPQQFVPNQIRGLVNSDGYLHVPNAEHERPHKAFLKFHRDHVFKG